MLPEPLFLNVHMYGIMVAVGVLAAFVVLYFYGKKLGFTQKFSDFIYYNALFSQSNPILKKCSFFSFFCHTIGFVSVLFLLRFRV